MRRFVSPMQAVALSLLAACSGPHTHTKPPTIDPGDDTGVEVVVLAPSDLAATSPFGQRVELTWTASVTDDDGYRLERTCTAFEGADADGLCVVGQLPAGTESFHDHHVDAGQSYTYQLTAIVGAGEATATVAVETPPTLDTPISPRPQGAWSLGPTLAMPTSVNLDQNVAAETLGLLLRESDPYSLPARLAAAGLQVTQQVGTDDPGAGELELFLHQTDGAPMDPEPDGLVTFEQMGDEGYVLLVEPVGEGVRLVVSAATAAGLYHGGMSAMSLLLDDELAAPRPDLDPQIVLDYPDHPVRSFYDYTVSINGPNDTEDGLAPEVLDYLDERSRAGANLAFHINYAQYPMSGGLPWKSWEEIVTEVGWLQEAAADRFLDIVYEVGDTGPSSSVLPGGYAFVDGLAVHGEPFLLEERTPGEWEAFAVSPPIQLVPDHEASDPSQWQAATLAGCEGWTYDPSVGHNTPGSWRLDADGSGNCATLTSDLDPTSIRDGRHLLATRLRSDSAGDHLGPFGTGYAQLSVYLTFDDGSVQSEHLAISSALGVSSPTATNHDGSDWFELYHTFVFDHEAQGLTVTDAYVYARSQTGVGTVWFDEVSLERIDGGFRNVAGGIQPPLVTSSDGGTVFVEGQDYTVCQVGEDLGVYTEICSSNLNDDNYETVFWARYWGGSLRYGYEPRYSRVLEPFRLIWLDDTTRPADDTILVSYDINLAYQSQTGTPGTPHVGQRYNFCDVDTLFDELAWGDAYDRVLGTGVDQLGAKHIRVGLSEVRGVNRSRICQAWVEENGSWSWQPTASNAARFADMANRLIDEAHLRDPDVMVFLWDDMLNPFDNGGNPNYQQTFGGPPGPSACALAPLSNPSLCSEIDDVDPISGDTVMIQWNYVVDGLWQTAAVAQWYDSVQQPWLIGPGGDALVAEDRAAIAHSSSEILGVSAFHFKNGDVPEQLRTFWNHDWRLMYLVDFETDASSHLPIDGPSLVVTVGEVTESSDGTCASHSATTGSTWEGNSDGGLCLDPATGMQGTVDAVAASGGLLHRAGLHIRVDSDTVPIQVPNLRFHYEQVDGSVLTSAWLPTIEVATLADGFDRYETAPPGVMAPEATVAVSVEIEVFPGVDAIDNLLFQQALPPCFDAC